MNEDTKSLLKAGCVIAFFFSLILLLGFSMDATSESSRKTKLLTMCIEHRIKPSECELPREHGQ